MTKPLALLLHEKLLPGSQLLNRLEDNGYRVQATNSVKELVELAKAEKPMLVFTDLRDRTGQVPNAIKQLKQDSETSHLPVIAYAAEGETVLQEAARLAGAALVVNESVLLVHLDHFMDQALQVE